MSDLALGETFTLLGRFGRLGWRGSLQLHQHTGEILATDALAASLARSGANFAVSADHAQPARGGIGGYFLAYQYVGFDRAGIDRLYSAGGDLLCQRLAWRGSVEDDRNLPATIYQHRQHFTQTAPAYIATDVGHREDQIVAVNEEWHGNYNTLYRRLTLAPGFLPVVVGHIGGCNLSPKTATGLDGGAFGAAEVGLVRVLVSRVGVTVAGTDEQAVEHLTVR